MLEKLAKEEKKIKQKTKKKCENENQAKSRLFTGLLIVWEHAGAFTLCFPNRKIRTL
jgi:hypothetical protein